MGVVDLMPVDSIEDLQKKFDNGESLLDKAIKAVKELTYDNTVIVGDESLTNLYDLNVVFAEAPAVLDHVTCQRLIEDISNSVDADIYLVINYRFPFIHPENTKSCVDTTINNGGWSFTGEKRTTLLWDKEKNQPINFDLSEAPNKDEGKAVHVETGAVYAFEKEFLSSVFEIKPNIIEIEGIECVGYIEEVPFDFVKSIRD